MRALTTHAPPTPVLACSQVSQVYRVDGRRVQALRGIDKTFPAGRVTTIAGPSGSGKSTMLRILACVDRADTGSVMLDGLDVTVLSERRRRHLRRRRLAYMFQNPADNLLDYLSSSEQIMLAGQLRGVTPDPTDIDDLLCALGLQHRRGHRPDELSGGEQQRLALACAVVGGPSVVLSDEPTAELDSASADLVLGALDALRERNVAFVLCTHDPLVIDASDHLLRLEHGETVESW